jgi:redox-sensitive bicupin YhaK (pirin superfamily)
VRRGRLRLLATRDGRVGTIRVRRDVDLYAALLGPGDVVAHALRPGRRAWVQVATGAVTLNGQPLQAGDGAAVEDEAALRLTAEGPAEVLLFDLG